MIHSFYSIRFYCISVSIYDNNHIRTSISNEHKEARCDTHAGCARAGDWLCEGEGLAVRWRGTGYMRVRDQLHDGDGLAV